MTLDSLATWEGSSGPSTGSQDSFAASGLVEQFFRREYGRLVAILTRKAGVRHVDLVEDAVQTALMAALRAVAIAEWQGPEAGLALLKAIEPPESPSLGGADRG